MCPTRQPAPTDDDPRIVTALLRLTESKSYRWSSFLTGCVVESLIFSLLILSEIGFGSVVQQQHPKPTTDKPHGVIYIPPVRKPAKPLPPPPNPLAKRRIPKFLEDPAPVPSKIKIDVSAIVISVVDDVTNEIPIVVQQQRGELALLQADDPSFARYTFNPPGWQMRAGMFDVSRRSGMKFRMSPPSMWPLLQTLASSNGIQMDRYQVVAMFDDKFSTCLEQEIRDHGNPPAGSGSVTAVELAFNSSRSCGIDVVNVEYAPAH